MSYCVNCGVELDASAEKCALCGTTVLNPSSPPNVSEHPFPELIVIPEKKKSQFRAWIVSVIMLLPCLVCLLINAFITPGSPWSIYVTAFSVLVWIVAVLPFILKEVHPYLLLLLDSLVILSNGFVFYYLVYAGSWFYRIFIPLDVLFLAIGSVLIGYFYKKKRSTVHTAVVILLAIAFYAGGLEIIFRISLPNILTDCISLSIAVSAIIMAMLLLVADNNEHFKAWLTRKFYM